MIAMDNSPDKAAPLIQIRAEWHSDQACWIAIDVLTGEDIAQADTLAEIELQVSLWANSGDVPPFHYMSANNKGRFLLH